MTVSAANDGMEIEGAGGEVSLAPGGVNDTHANLIDNIPHLVVLHVDVDQGESTIVIERYGTQARACYIIDGGLSKKSGAIARYLTKFGVSVVDYLICSHFDRDHVAGLRSFLDERCLRPEQTPVAGRFHVGSVIARTINRDHVKSSAASFFVALESAVVTSRAPAAANAFYDPTRLGTGLRAQCLHAANYGLLDHQENDGSLAFKFTYDGFRYYTAGDLPTGSEDHLGVGQVDALKCGHHGSAGSTSDFFLNQTRPKVAFISCGRNPFGHPSVRAVQGLQEQAAVINFFLTNCFLNRGGINPAFVNTDEQVRSTLHRAFYTLNAQRPVVIDGQPPEFGSWAGSIAMMTPAPKNETQQYILELARQAARHREWFDGQGAMAPKGVVAGQSNVAGTVAVVVRHRPLGADGDTPFCVGVLNSTGAPQWGTFQNAHPFDYANLCHDIGPRLGLSQVATGVADAQPSSPGGYAQDFAARVASYHAFDAIGRGGGTGHGAAAAVDFCAFCRSDVHETYLDDNAPFDLYRLQYGPSESPAEEIAHLFCAQTIVELDEGLKAQLEDQIASLTADGSGERPPLDLRPTHAPPAAGGGRASSRFSLRRRPAVRYDETHGAIFDTVLASCSGSALIADGWIRTAADRQTIADKLTAAAATHDEPEPSGGRRGLFGRRRDRR